MLKIPIEVSARHCHLSSKHADKLFGVNYQFKILKSLSQKGMFAAQETVTLKTKAGEIKNLRVLGPTRRQTQIELAITDARRLKISPPLRLSGDLAGSVGGLLIGPKGRVVLKQGIIIAARHIHSDSATAKKLGLKIGRLVKVKVFGRRAATLENIAVRVGSDFVLGLHLDTDEGNACLDSDRCSYGELIVK